MEKGPGAKVFTRTVNGEGALEIQVTRLAYQGPQDEIGHLTTTFNLMIERLEAAFEVQRRQMADTAHELRLPLATILGNADLLLRCGQDPQRRQLALASIRIEGERTARLAADLLLLAQAALARSWNSDPWNWTRS